MVLPIRARITIWTTALLAIILVVVGAFLVVRLRVDLVHGVDASLTLASSEIVTDFTTGAETEFRDVSDRSMAGLDRSRSAAQVLSADGRVLDYAALAPSGRALLPPTLVRAAAGGRPVVLTSSLGLGQGDFRAVATRFPNGPSSRVLVVATSLSPTERSVHRLVVLLWISLPVALVLCQLGGWWLARKALAPVSEMTEEAAGIGADRPDGRVNVPPARDELQRLALTLNGMLERLQGAIEQQRRFTADASHELRTPLAVMRAELGLATQARGMPAETREALESSHEEVLRMSRLVDDLLTLARIDAGKLELLRLPSDVGEIADHVGETLAPLARRRGVNIRTSRDGPAGLMAAVDRERVTQVITNLLDNAITHSTRGQEVRVATSQRQWQIRVAVTDEGPGISPDDLPHLFERFYRSDRARSRSDGGSGLGLAISKEIVAAHGGEIWVESEPGHGSVFSFSLPAIKPDDAATTGLGKSVPVAGRGKPG